MKHRYSGNINKDTVHYVSTRSFLALKLFCVCNASTKHVELCYCKTDHTYWTIHTSSENTIGNAYWKRNTLNCFKSNASWCRSNIHHGTFSLTTSKVYSSLHTVKTLLLLYSLLFLIESGFFKSYLHICIR